MMIIERFFFLDSLRQWNCISGHCFWCFKTQQSWNIYDKHSTASATRNWIIMFLDRSLDRSLHYTHCIVLYAFSLFETSFLCNFILPFFLYKQFFHVSSCWFSYQWKREIRIIIYFWWNENFIAALYAPICTERNFSKFSSLSNKQEAYKKRLRFKKM